MGVQLRLLKEGVHKTSKRLFGVYFAAPPESVEDDRFQEEYQDLEDRVLVSGVSDKEVL